MSFGCLSLDGRGLLVVGVQPRPYFGQLVADDRRSSADGGEVHVECAVGPAQFGRSAVVVEKSLKIR